MKKKFMIALIIAPLILFWGLASMGYGTNLTVPLRYGDGLTTVNVLTYVLNGATNTYVLVVDADVTVFPAIHNATLNDTANWIIKEGFLYDGETDTLWVNSHWNIKNLIDTIVLINAEVAGVNGLTPVQAATNMGINWGDITNQATAVDLSATITNLVNTATTVTGGATTANIALKFDTLSAWMTAGLGHKSHTDYDSDRDTIWVVMRGSDDTLGILEFFHISGVAGQRPDSVLAKAKP